MSDNLQTNTLASASQQQTQHSSIAVAEPLESRFQRTPVQKLVWDLKVTAGARFNAAERLKRRDRSSSTLVSIYSALLVCLSVSTLAFPFDETLVRYLGFGGVVASVLVLVVSMKNYAHQFGVDAEQMHRCALELNELRREMLADPGVESRLNTYAVKHNLILHKWSINHSEEDFLKYKYKHKWEFQDIADVPDKKLPDRRFQEYNDVSAGGVALATIIGLAVLLLLGYVIWDTITTLAEDTAQSANTALQTDADQTQAWYRNENRTSQKV